MYDIPTTQDLDRLDEYAKSLKDLERHVQDVLQKISNIQDATRNFSVLACSAENDLNKRILWALSKRIENGETPKDAIVRQAKVMNLPVKRILFVYALRRFKTADFRRFIKNQAYKLLANAGYKANDILKIFDERQTNNTRKDLRALLDAFPDKINKDVTEELEKSTFFPRYYNKDEQESQNEFSWVPDPEAKRRYDVVKKEIRDQKRRADQKPRIRNKSPLFSKSVLSKADSDT